MYDTVDGEKVITPLANIARNKIENPVYFPRIDKDCMYRIILKIFKISGGGIRRRGAT